MLAAVTAVALRARANRRRGAAGSLVVLWAFLLVAGAALLPLAEPRLSARNLGRAIEHERGRGTRIAAWRITEGSLGQFLFYSGGTVDWIGAAENPAQASCVECRLTVDPTGFLAGPGRRACLMTEDGYAELPAQARGGRILARGRVGGSSYILLGGTR